MSISECVRYCQRNLWSDTAVRVIHTADTKAQERRCDYIGTEHLLLALVADANSAATLLEEHHHNASREIIAQFEKLLGPIPESVTPTFTTRVIHRIKRMLKLYSSLDNLSLTPRTVNAVKTATELASTTLNWIDHHVRCEHILFACLSDSDSVAYQVLANIGTSYEDLLLVARRRAVR